MNLRLTSSALALAAMTAPAFADVTPEQVWQSWVDYYKSVGYTITEGSRDKSGSTLTVKDIKIAGGAEASRVGLSLPEIVLTDTGDGKVKTVFADHMTVDLSGTNADGKNYELPATLDMPGNSMISSGAPEDMTHEFNYPTLKVTLTTVTTDGKQTPLPVNFALLDSTGTAHLAGGATGKYDYDMSSAKLTFDGDVTDENQENVKFAGSAEKLSTKGTMNLPGKIADLETELGTALRNGLAMDGAVQIGPIAATFQFSGKDENDQPTSGAGKYEGKGFDGHIKMSQDGLSYQLGSDPVSFEITSPQMPMPIRYGFDKASLDLQMPVSKSDTPQPFKLAYALSGLTLGDEIWATFDPEAKLPRDPASLDIDVTGTMKVIRDLLDVPPPKADGASDQATDEAAADAATDQAADQSGDQAADAATDQAEADGMDDGMDGATDEAQPEEEPSPFEPVDLTINQFALKAVGASIQATGALKAPESGDMTMPVGNIHAEYEGVSALIDKLVGMGLIQQDQVMGVRMMLAMFAKPVDGNPDKLVTDLEFKDGGQVFANGQQIK
ncbi:DUF2125 domain-containing protein [Paracoccus limosus]|uniref:DUF2125 domain-containing protein n=1 Tax=Paracoccus limosus TaxID=913252 RepID=A0A844H8P3_9RHOB|nr:DUF2125 domain-containing protein [Paracoccus limosus]MTH35721.1 DUF2125 domain-containing protein [Paracoccus limosus]